MSLRTIEKQLACIEQMLSECQNTADRMMGQALGAPPADMPEEMYAAPGAIGAIDVKLDYINAKADALVRTLALLQRGLFGEDDMPEPGSITELAQKEFDDLRNRYPSPQAGGQAATIEAMRR